MKLKLNNNIYSIEETPSNNSFTVILSKENEISNVVSELTINNLKEFKYIESEELYSIISNKKYSNKYLVKKKDDMWYVTFYLEDISTLEGNVEENTKNITQAQADIEYIAMASEVEL